MSITDLVNFLKLKGFEDVEIYPLSFPASSPNRSMLVETGDGTQAKGVLSDFVLTITVRDIHPSKAEELAADVLERLHGITGEYIGETYVVLIKAQSPLPAFLGKDEENRYFYSVNLRVLV
ncbi:minor capsid protein [Bacillus safensis]|uniref:DUF3168 domain-containing protein n=1 Tax=Bacillus safensis TaxID=561879 RepID=A0A1L6ZJ82_BACIA|nr:minor capsid protein [Bacillus safensis]APT46583.1 hypothetical protein BSA145_12425 [Bacillus safensis]